VFILVFTYDWVRNHTRYYNIKRLNISVPIYRLATTGGASTPLQRTVVAADDECDGMNQSKLSSHYYCFT